MAEDPPGTSVLGWSDYEGLTNDPEHSNMPSVAVDAEDNLHVVWAVNSPEKHAIY